MNAVHPPISKASSFKWLLKREFWENRGGFLWAPLVAGAISLLLTAFAIGAGLMAIRKASANQEFEIDGFSVNGMDLGLLVREMTPERAAELARALDMTLFLSGTWPFLVLAFVAFFYCLGALYDERRDRSVLFWKSLPLSDTQTVLSKAVSALVVAPLLAVVAAILTMFGFLLMISVVVLAHGGNPVTLVWGPASPLLIAAGLLSWIPVYALWALPTAGWLLFCSAWARSKPFLWAVTVPVFAGVIVHWFDLMRLFGLPASWFWTHIVGRLLLGTFPGADLPFRGGSASVRSALQDISPMSQLNALAMPELWIGVVVGVALLVAAVYMRRHRDEA